MPVRTTTVSAGAELQRRHLVGGTAAAGVAAISPDSRKGIRTARVRKIRMPAKALLADLARVLSHAFAEVAERWSAMLQTGYRWNVVLCRR